MSDLNKKTATASNAQVKIVIYPDRITHTNNGITHQHLLSSGMIGIRQEEFSVFTPLTNSRIGTIVMVPQMLKSPEVQEIVTDTASNNTGINRTPQQISKTGIGGTTPYHSGISETSTPALSDINGTIIDRNYAPTCGIIETSGISGTSAAPPSSGLWSPRIVNIRQSTTPNFRKSNELNADISREFSNDTIVPTVITQVFYDKLSSTPSRDIYTRFRVNLSTEGKTLGSGIF